MSKADNYEGYDPNQEKKWTKATKKRPLIKELNMNIKNLLQPFCPLLNSSNQVSTQKQFCVNPLHLQIEPVNSQTIG